MDALDRRIVAIYQHDTRRIAESIGVEVGLSAAAVQRRLKRLREAGVIRAELALLDSTALGVPITCVVTLSMASTPSKLDRFKRQMRSVLQVQQCYHVTGSQDFVLVVTAASMEDYRDFARQWFESDEHVARYETHVVLDRVKIGLALPLPIEERANKKLRARRSAPGARNR